MSTRAMSIMILVLAVAAALTVASWPAGAQEADPAPVVDKCKADLAQRAQVTSEEIKVTLVERITWSDGSLGCPEPGMMYTQALVPGFRIVLTAGEKAYHYHTDQAGRQVKYCENPPDLEMGAKPPTERPKPEVTGPPLPPASMVVLYLEEIPNEPNLNQKLMARELGPGAAQPVTVLAECSDFVVSQGGLILAKRRTSRSTHELVLTRPGGEPKLLAAAFDFAGLTWLEGSASYFFLAAPNVGSGYAMHGGEASAAEPVALEWAPKVKRGRDITVSARQGVVVVSAAGGEDSSQREVIVLDLQAQKVLTTFRSTKAAPALVLPAPPAPTEGPATEGGR